MTQSCSSNCAPVSCQDVAELQLQARWVPIAQVGVIWEVTGTGLCVRLSAI